MSWDKGGGYLHRNAQQAHAMSWVGQRRRPAGYMFRDDVAKALGVTVRTVNELVRRGELHSYPSEAGGALRIYREAEVFEVAARRMIARGLKAAP